MLAGFALLLTSLVASRPDINPHRGDHPCRIVEAACTDSGYLRQGAKPGKVLFKDCVRPLLDGKTVEGVTVDPGAVHGCQVKRAEHQKNPHPPADGDAAPPAGTGK